MKPQKFDRLYAKKMETESKFSPVKKRLRRSEESSSRRNDDEEHKAPRFERRCFICDEVGDKTWESRKAMTFNLNHRVLQAATLTNNESLKRKFLDGDIIALDAEYHLKCLSKLYREAALCERGTYGKTEEETEKRELIFHEPLEYLEVFRETSSCISMSFITKMYKQNLDS